MAVRPGARALTPHPPPELVLARDHLGPALASAVRTGTLERVARGAYLLRTPERDPCDIALARIAATHRRLQVPHWFSHESAALLWGWPLWQTPSHTHVYTTARTGAGGDPLVRRHRGQVPDGLTTQVNGLPLTTGALTAADCLRTLPPLDAMVVLDAALRCGVDRNDICAILEAAVGRGVRWARLRLAHGDGGAESARETATRLALLRAGAPTPQTQVRVDTASGTYWADLGIVEWRLLIEYDGRAKYTCPDDIYTEKLRQDAITAAGYRMIRATARTPLDTVATHALTYAPPGFHPICRPELNA
ncbi:MAG: hypothetical protein FWF02_02385 [Micrococcales bacterium]|nr:hypothetical protein [Micrococcales bacterium]MCL2666539.1 hypothetical protein [Micrococcales bacterium]